MKRIETRTFLTLGLLALLAVGAQAGDGRQPLGPSFLTGPQEGEPFDLAMSYIQGHLEEIGLTEADLVDLRVRDHYVSRHNGVTHIHLQQRLGGVEVWNGVMNINVARDGAIINLGNGFIRDLAGTVNTVSPTLSDREAISRAAGDLGLSLDPDSLTLLSAEFGGDLKSNFEGAGLSRDAIPARLVYQPLADGSVRLAWETTINRVDTPDWWQMRVDAVTGEMLSKNNLTSYDSYLAVPFPAFEHPNQVPGGAGQEVVTDPADPTASPFGWHDTDGAAGAEFTDTRGNNVDAHDDINADNIPGIRPDGGPTLDFAFPLDQSLPPDGAMNLEAAIVNLFYANNVMHDLTYFYGFDEAGGNFQLNTYGNGGIGNDPVQADAQDGSGTNNANFATPPDGISGRMQMFRWLAVINSSVELNAPDSGTFEAAQPGWGGALPVTGDLEVVDDGTAMGSEGCNPLIGFTPGNVALIDRGNCEFGAKSVNAENAGATGVIIINDPVNQGANGVLSMGAGAQGGNVTIPAVMIGNADGQTVLAALPANATVAADPSAPPDRDSDFDNGVIAHEYGHGISNRLTGGPSNVSCLNGSEQAGEGWSDFWGLLLTAKAEDTAEMPRGVGNYLIFEEDSGPGIRNFPYTTDMAVNPQTYANINGTNVPHGVGEIWMAMVWEMYWELVNKHGFDEDFYNGTGGNNMTIQLVMDGMKLQPCLPDFVEAREAILLADLVNYAGDNRCEIWRAFAKRGLGAYAVAGNPLGAPIVGDEVENFELPADCDRDGIFYDGFESGDITRW